MGIYHAYSAWICYEMEYKMEKGLNLDTLILNEAEYKVAVISKKELIYQDEFFDIKTIHKEGNTITLSGIWDKDESRLKKEIESKADSDFTTRILKLFPILLTPFVLSKVPELIIYSFKSQKAEMPNFQCTLLFANLQKPVRPPIYLE